MKKDRAGYIIRLNGDESPATCVKCGNTKSIFDFYTHSIRSDGAIRYRNPCKDCRKKGPRTQWSRPVHAEIISSGKQKCGKCHEIKPLEEFYSNGCYKDGVKKYRTTCIKCVLEKSTEKYQQNKHETTYKRGLTARNYITNLINKSSHRKRNHTLDINYVMDLYNNQNGLCALSGRKMTHITGKGRVWTNISIDRIDSRLDYVKGNVQLVCLGPNLMKQNMHQDEMVSWCRDIVRKYDGIQNSSLAKKSREK